MCRRWLDSVLWWQINWLRSHQGTHEITVVCSHILIIYYYLPLARDHPDHHERDIHWLHREWRRLQCSLLDVYGRKRNRPFLWNRVDRLHDSLDLPRRYQERSNWQSNPYYYPKDQARWNPLSLEQPERVNEEYLQDNLLAAIHEQPTLRVLRCSHNIRRSQERVQAKVTHPKELQNGSWEAEETQR